jgi:hypothetical protein
MYRLLNCRNCFAVLVLALVMTVSAAIVNAQIVGGELEAKIPFEFTAGSTRLPAGTYLIRPTGEYGAPILELTTVDSKVGVLLETIPAQAKPDQTSELIFDKMGDRYFLREIWAQGTAEGYTLEKPRAERQLEKGGHKAERHRLPAIHHKTRTRKP